MNRHVLLFLLLLIPSVALAQLDVAPMVTSLETAEDGIALVVAAALLVLGLIIGWRYIKIATGDGFDGEGYCATCGEVTATADYENGEPGCVICGEVKDGDETASEEAGDHEMDGSPSHCDDCEEVTDTICRYSDDSSLAADFCAVCGAFKDS